MKNCLAISVFLVVLLQASFSHGQHVSPKEVVNLFLQVYGTEHMAEILPLTGHKTRRAFERYSLVNEADLFEANQRLSEYLARRG